MYDILIKNGNIVDGAGKPAFLGSLGIKGNKIVDIGEIRGLAKKTIDAKKHFVVPGFIDILTHSDVFLNIFNNPKQESFLQQGITTIIGGNCGVSLAPLLGPKSIELIKKWANIENVTINWAKVDEFLNSVKKLRLGVNFGTLSGYSTARRVVREDESEELERDDLAKVEIILNDALAGGALGISIDLALPQKGGAPLVEMARLGQIVNDHGKVLSVHLKDEGEGITASINEILQMAEETKVSVELSHFKIISQNIKTEDVLSLIQNYADNGINVNFDVYPYGTSATTLYSLLPEWSREGGTQDVMGRLGDSLLRSKIIKDLQKSDVAVGEILLSHVGRNKFFLNKTINEIAGKDNISVEEALLNLILISNNDAAGFLYAKNEDSIRTLLKSKLALASSDGAGFALAHDASRNQLIHPRNFGAFPYLLGRYAREEKLLSVEEIIPKITSLPAKKYGLKGRGFLAKNYFADICIFDFERVGSQATFQNPFVCPEGILGLVVGGNLVLWDKKLVGNFHGEVFS